MPLFWLLVHRASAARDDLFARLRRPVAKHARGKLHAQDTLGEVVADRVADFLGSWRFIGVQSLFVLMWIAANCWLLSRPFDPFPMILLNLLFSTQAAYTGPLVLLAANRQAARDRARDDLEAKEVAAIYRLLRELTDVNTRQAQSLAEHGEMLRLLKRRT